MIKTYASPPLSPYDRGADFGEHHAEQIRQSLAAYERLISGSGLTRSDMTEFGARVMTRVEPWSAAIASEISGIAAGADLPVGDVAALNARTELVAFAGLGNQKECSTVVRIDESSHAIGAQTWDWHDHLGDSWFVWSIEHEDGRVTHTMTEYGILAKIGINSRRLALLLNFLHHERDAGTAGIPIHLLARRVLDDARDINEAATILGAAEVSASTSFTLLASDGRDATALSVEKSPAGVGIVLPERGILCHTNHFLNDVGGAGDTAARTGPDSFFRLEMLRRRAADLDADVTEVLESHLGSGGAICCHPTGDSEMGSRWETLATVVIDIARPAMTVYKGGPCTRETAARETFVGSAPALQH
jgi:isopenicillin-N N-acyltransferase-like protein